MSKKKDNDREDRGDLEQRIDELEDRVEDLEDSIEDADVGDTQSGSSKKEDRTRGGGPGRYEDKEH